MFWLNTFTCSITIIFWTYWTVFNSQSCHYVHKMLQISFGSSMPHHHPCSHSHNSPTMHSSTNPVWFTILHVSLIQSMAVWHLLAWVSSEFFFFFVAAGLTMRAILIHSYNLSRTFQKSIITDCYTIYYNLHFYHPFILFTRLQTH